MADNPLLAIPGMQAGLVRVETALRESVRSDDPFLTEVASHLITAGGKRVRPAFALAAAATSTDDDVDAVSDDVVMGAVAVELVHLGSLYHDDVMDEATTRRTVESVNAKWGNLQAILAGDFLLARASEIAASLGVEVAALLASTIGRLCEGQVRELRDTYNVGRTEADYLSSIEGKTASLFATACRVGAIVGDLPREEVDALTEFGLRFGMAFQIVDDILDVTATDEQLGKPSGHDLVEGVYTLPVIRTMAAGNAPDLAPLLGGPLEEGALDRARSMVRADGAVASSLETAAGYAQSAIESLHPLPHATAALRLGEAAQHLLAGVRAAA
ncbi:MAG: polyprenyl synthetase family protein [Acidimicrobiales bacterium]|nr:polyprenyl synthetase family protein [Acidimicrobiales bacterium]MCB1017189.1 polyprenyl synthetase family protein [Acidimicrobiales bacterium]